LIQQPENFRRDFATQLLGIYEVDSAQLESDLQVLLGELSERGLNRDTDMTRPLMALQPPVAVNHLLNRRDCSPAA